MRNISYKYLSASILMLFFAITSIAQSVYKLDAKNSKLTITGTSSLSDWEMEAKGFNAETGLKIKGNAVSEIQYVKFSSPVAGLESGNKSRDNKARETLKEKKFPQIEFSMSGNGITFLSGQKTDITGILTIAGIIKEIKVPVDFIISSGRQFTVDGKVHLKMSDFGIDPPTAFLGIIKTDDEVEVKYNLKFDEDN